MKKFKMTVLILSGLALFYASASRLIDPSAAIFLQTFFENPENSLETAIDLTNEIRGVGAVMLLGGFVALIGTIRADFRQTSFVVTTVIFGGVILGRLFSFFVDGVPHQELLRVAMIEGALALLSLICLVNILTRSQASLSKKG